MELVIALVIFSPFLLIAVLLAFRFMQVRGTENFSSFGSIKFDAWIEEVHYEDGNILVRNETIFKEGLMLAYPKPDEVFRGQRVVLVKRGMEWQLYGLKEAMRD